jgi:hypothetical protein
MRIWHWGKLGCVLSLSIRSLVFSILYVFGSGASCLIFCENDLARLYAGAFLQLTTGLMGWPGLCNLMRPFMVGADGFMFVYFHPYSCGIRILLLITVFLIWDWKVLVGSLCVVLKLLFCIKSCSLRLYCWDKEKADQEIQKNPQ